MPKHLEVFPDLRTGDFAPWEKWRLRFLIGGVTSLGLFLGTLLPPVRLIGLGMVLPGFAETISGYVAGAGIVAAVFGLLVFFSVIEDYLFSKSIKRGARMPGRRYWLTMSLSLLSSGAAAFGWYVWSSW